MNYEENIDPCEHEYAFLSWSNASMRLLSFIQFSEFRSLLDIRFRSYRHFELRAVLKVVYRVASNGRWHIFSQTQTTPTTGIVLAFFAFIHYHCSSTLDAASRSETGEDVRKFQGSLASFFLLRSPYMTREKNVSPL